MTYGLIGISRDKTSASLCYSLGSIVDETSSKMPIFVIFCFTWIGIALFFAIM